jgi:hypothetical protein
MAAMTGGVTVGHGLGAAQVTAAACHGRAAAAGWNRRWDPPPGGTGG